MLSVCHEKAVNTKPSKKKIRNSEEGRKILDENTMVIFFFFAEVNTLLSKGSHSLTLLNH